MVDGEWVSKPDWALSETTDWLKNVKLFGAIAFQLEHRYYGESMPTEYAQRIA